LTTHRRPTLRPGNDPSRSNWRTRESVKRSNSAALTVSIFMSTDDAECISSQTQQLRKSEDATPSTPYRHRPTPQDCSATHPDYVVNPRSKRNPTPQRLAEHLEKHRRR
jgi:hypothetical protein